MKNRNEAKGQRTLESFSTSISCAIKSNLLECLSVETFPPGHSLKTNSTDDGHQCGKKPFLALLADDEGGKLFRVQ